MTGKRIRDYGFRPGRLQPGKLNKISDVPGVLVGHCTVDNERHKTGVTVILPHGGNMYTEPVVAATNVINGFGKTAGLMQVNELGNIETPIALTGTTNVGLVFDALVEHTIRTCAAVGKNVRTVNPVVGETNDASLNDNHERIVGYEEVKKAIEGACGDFDEGDVGAGKGTSCFGLKGGIGSASRVLEIEGRQFTVGALVQSNFGSTADLTVCGQHVGEWIVEHRDEVTPARLDQGSVMIILATDLPVDSRQLQRMCRRAVVGLARVGSFVGHGSGDVVIGFTTANRINGDAFRQTEVLREGLLESAFRAVAESVEESVLNSLAAASAVTGYSGTVRHCLSEYIEAYKESVK